MTDPCGSKRTSGWLWLFSKNVFTYEKMWFVLSNGVLTHYTDQEEQTCRGGMRVTGSIIDIPDPCQFMIWQDGEPYLIKAVDPDDKERWVKALMAAREAQQSQDSIDASTEIDGKNPASASQFGPLMELSLITHTKDAKIPCEQASSTVIDASSNDETRSAKSNDAGTQRNHRGQDGSIENDEALLATANDVVLAQMSTREYTITDEPAKNTDSHYGNITGNEIQSEHHRDRRQPASTISTMLQKLKDLETSNDLVKECDLDLRKSLTAMENQQGNHNFQDVCHQASKYQQAASAMTKACIDYTDFAQSYTRQWITLCQSEHEQRVKLEHVIKSLTQAQSESSESISGDDESFEYFDCCETTYTSELRFVDTLQVYQVVGGPSGNRTRRTRIPDRPNVSDSLWSVLKHCIGNDLSKMPLPVSFAEPLSLLQRLTEDFEYADVLDRASECTDTATQIAHVAAFISSSYSTTVGRTGKPFNPLLGETYECDRSSDLGWKSIAEQVSHHPPVAAIYCESKKWEFWMDQSMKSKFKGTTLTIIPLGECHLSFRNGNRYSWKKPNTSIHNVIVGKLWVEQEGDVDIKCHTSDVTCKLTFVSSGWTGENFTLKGVVKDGNGKAVHDIAGKYSTQIDYRPAGSKDPGTVVWKRTEPPADNAKYYGFTLLACQLNEMEDGVAPTDSRLRPDQRLMEEGKFDAANATKKRLEEFQRANKQETWTPTWFKRQADPDTKTEMWTYGGEYWPCKTKKDWSRCPSHIFSPPNQ